MIFLYLFILFILVLVIKNYHPNCKHDWYYGQFRIHGFKSKWTGDSIGRPERHCPECNKKQISLSSFRNGLIKDAIKLKYGDHEYYSYKEGDWLDQFTMYHLCANSIPEEQLEELEKKCEDIL